LRLERSKAEWSCLLASAGGQDPSHAQKVATIIGVQELKGYMLQLHKENRLDESAKTAIQNRLSELEAFYGRKLG
jgi:hypothetical protein